MKTPLPAIKQSFEVRYTYELHFTTDLFASNNSLLANTLKPFRETGSVKCLFVIDSGVNKHHPQLVTNIQKYAEKYVDEVQIQGIVEVPGGEASKNNDLYLEKILAAINNGKICKHSFVIVIGGGAVIDLAGYAAAIAHRGVKLIRIPTTVLSQNDAAVGVKNGINYFGKKNFIGTFMPPVAIINDVKFLTTLEQRDWISGIAEAIKVALLKDAIFFKFIADNAPQLATRNMEVMGQLIHRCAELHMQHIAKGGDPFESGSSRPLDFGHWAAHKLEQMTNYELRHGEAVAIGLALDVTYANAIGLLDDEDLKSILNTMETIGFSLEIPLDNMAQFKELMDGIEEFREHLGGQLTITLINAIGSQHDVHEIDFDKMIASIKSRSRKTEPLST